MIRELFQSLYLTGVGFYLFYLLCVFCPIRRRFSDSDWRPNFLVGTLVFVAFEVVLASMWFGLWVAFRLW